MYQKNNALEHVVEHFMNGLFGVPVSQVQLKLHFIWTLEYNKNYETNYLHL